MSASRTDKGSKGSAGAANSGVRERAIEAYDSARERASESVTEAPLLVVGSGLALGALIAALVPRTRIEERYLSPLGNRISEGAKAAASAAKDAGREKLSELNITKDAGTSAVQSLIDGISEAAKTSGQAALGAVRNKG